jgi:hypothetical protein
MSPSHRLLYWSMVAIIRPSQTGPQAIEPSPMLQMTMPFLLLIFLYSAAPTEMSAEPPTMALFG